MSTKEAWKYTNLNKIKLGLDNTNPTQPVSINKNQIQPYLLPNSQYLILVNGFVCEEYSDIKFNIIDDTINLTLDKNNQTIQILHLSTQSINQQQIKTNITLTLPENKNINLLEQYASLDNSEFYCLNTVELNLSSYSKLNYTKIQNLSNKSNLISNLILNQNNNSHFMGFYFNLGSLLSREDIMVNLNGEHCESFLNGLNVPTHTQHIDQFLTINHNNNHSHSSQKFKNIVNDQARTVFRGKVIVNKNAVKNKAEQENHNLLLSNQAEADTLPQLEIYNDDVQCSHGATVGQLDEQALFYLTSRGVNKTDAKNILIYSFARDYLNGVENIELRDALQHKILTKLNMANLNMTECMR